MLVLIFNRIFDGHDVTRIALVDLVYERRESGGFARARRATDQDEPATQPRQITDLGWKPKLAKHWHLHRQRPDRSRGVPALAVQVNAKSSQPGNSIRTIGNLRVAVLGRTHRGQNRLHQSFNLGAIERNVSNLFDCPVDTNRGSNAMHQKQVTATAAEQFLQKLV